MKRVKDVVLGNIQDKVSNRLTAVAPQVASTALHVEGFEGDKDRVTPVRKKLARAVEAHLEAEAQDHRPPPGRTRRRKP